MSHQSIEQRRAYDRQRYRKLKKDREQGQRKMNFNLRLPEQWVAMMQRIAMEGISKGTNPWKTTQEVARALIGKGFEAMKGEHELVDDFLPMLHLEEQLSGLARAQRTAEAMLGMAKKNIRALLNIHADDTALQYYATALTSAKELPKTVWSQWLLDQLAKSFPDLAREEAAGRVPGVKLKRGTATKRKT